MDHRPTNPARFKGVLVATLAAILVASLLPTAALANHNPGSDDPCDGAPPASDFADYEQARDTHQPSIDCALYRGITSGAGVNPEGAPLYRPRRAVNRAQMAQFIVNTIVAAGYDDALPGGQGEDEFNDIRDSFARVAINRLARAEIVRGTGRNRYSPEATVTRQQMASFIVQAARFVVGEQHPVRRDDVDRFRDVENNNAHKANIEAGADADLFRGTSATTFSPGIRVIRDQMASFLVNLVGHSFNPDQAPAPYTAEVNVAATTVAAGEPVSGDIVGDHIERASVSGCGLNDAALTDRDNQAEGIQFEVAIPADQDAGSCTLTFSVTFDNNSIRRFTQDIMVTAENRATVTLAKDTAHPGETITGDITGSNVKSAVVSGCGLTNEAVEDRDTAKAGIQLSETIPATQALGPCTLTFTVTFNDNETEDVAKPITIEEKVGVTTRPELISAEIVSTTAGGSSPGTVVRFVFDEAITGGVPVGNRFLVYSFDATSDSGTSPRVDPANSRAVLVRFTDLTTPAQAADLTVVTVQPDAVTDGQQGNPHGNAAVGTQREDTIRQPGDTAAPDLESVGPFRPGDDQGTTAVDFAFDETTYVVSPGGFHLVLNDATVVNCQGPAVGSDTPSGGNEAGGDGTNRITVICTNPSSGGSTVQLSASNVARGYVDANAVSDAEQDVTPVNDEAEGNTNALQAAAVGATAPTASPDLVSATFTPGAGSAADQVVYTFDEAVVLTTANPLTGAPANLFRVYNTAGSEVSATGATRGSNDRTVTATFDNGTLADAVGASVRAGAVQGLSSGTNNRADEVGVSNSTTRTITPGRTAGPDLLSVAINQDDDSVTYTFDEDVNSSPTGGQASDPQEFYLWLATGERLTCSGFPGTSSFSIDGAQVTCTAYRGSNNAPASAADVEAAVLGSVGAEAVDDAESGETKNPEGAAPTTGGTGSPQN